MNWRSLKTEGGILSPTIIEKLVSSPYELRGQKPEDFGFKNEQDFKSAVYEAWEDALHYWEAFKRRLERGSSESITTITREQWVIPLLEVLGFKLTYQQRWEEVNGKKYHISHRAGDSEEAPPVHIVGCDQDLGNRPPSGRSSMSPHALLQDYLNKTDHLWGIVTNGYILRVLRDSFYFSKPSYIEFDLRQMMEGRLLDEFFILYRLIHRSRFPKGMSDAKDCLLEHYHTLALEEGGRIREGLRKAVEKAIEHLANGFLRHPKNEFLREKIRKGDLSARDLYRELLYLVYRILFLSVAEDRNQIRDSRGFYRHLSVSRLRKLVEERKGFEDRYHDLYLSLRTLFHILRRDEHAKEIGLPAFDGQLFAELENLDSACISNRDLLEAIKHLSYFTPKDEDVVRRINYAYIDVEEFGSVYESLLDLEPVIREENGKLTFKFSKGLERRSTGSYYTPHSLVKELINSALVPVLEQKLKGKETKEEKEKAILSIKVCDPACGSGHFLLEAARYLGKELAKVRTQSDEPSPEEIRKAIRDVISHCIYGVDKNPLAVDLCKVALWIEGSVEGKPLTFLDHRIKCGDSLVGVFRLDTLREGIPQDAYKPVSGDDKGVAKLVKNMNKEQLKGQRSLFKLTGKKYLDAHTIAEGRMMLEEITEESADDIRIKEELYKDLLESEDFRRKKLACDLWTGAFFVPLTQENFTRDVIPTTDDLFSALEGKDINPELEKFVSRLAQRHRFFHWELEFPEVFEQGGFDLVLGNPPWDKIKLQEREFFSTRAPEIAEAENASKRKRMIEDLKFSNPQLYSEFLEAKHYAEAVSLFTRSSGRFPLTARGDVNTYSVFAELALRLINPKGRAGIIVPTGIATDDSNKFFFNHIMEKGLLSSLYDFENREKLFPSVDSRYKFSLLTLQGSPSSDPPSFVFFATKVDHLKDQQRRFSLTYDEIKKINPNTRTTPVFRTKVDAELTKKIYERVPVLVNEEADENPWNVRFNAMFHMSNDSHLFRTRKQLEEEGFELAGNRFVRGDEIWLPLYEAKMIWLYDHRFGTYEGVSSRSSTHLPTPDESHHADPSFLVQPWYWVSKEEVERRLRGWEREWLIGFRDIARSTDERTAIFSLLPNVGVGNKIPLIMSNSLNNIKSNLQIALLANVSSLIFDYFTRQKIAGTSMNFFYVNQLPVLPPDAYTEEDLLFIVPRVLELVYTAWDIKPFADDVWNESDQRLREAIRRQWEENKNETGGNSWKLPWWIEAYPEIETDLQKGIPLPPFRWDESRRAKLRAELDAYYAKLYGLTDEELLYILDPQEVYGENFPGETFRVLKEKELKTYGEYRTKRLVLETWEGLK